MSFELTIAVKRDPTSGRAFEPGPSGDRTSCTSIALSGTFDEAAADAVLATISDIAAKSSDSILIEMDDIEANDARCLERFADGLMSLRAATVHVQVAVEDPTLHGALAALGHSRDWLLRLADIDPSVPRLAVHLDGSSSTATGDASAPATPVTPEEPNA